jgi:hypothetical protein
LDDFLITCQLAAGRSELYVLIRIHQYSQPSRFFKLTQTAS